jgi:RHS repeat-associated protein
MTDIVYPNGRDISYSYGTAGGMDDILSQTATIGSGSDSYSSYSYLGAGTIVTENYLEPQVQLDYSANNYAAWDRFGRVLSQVWATYGGTPTTLDGYDYTYDRASNRTSRNNLTDAAFNEIYGYDGVNRLTSDTRNGNAYQQWTLDSLGNWSGFTNNGQSQTSTFDPANELTTNTGTVTPAYDAAGNMTTTPSPSSPQTGLTCTYDAWNRMVQVASGTTIVGVYQYDGTNRRTEKLTNFNTSGVPQNVVYYFYSGQQVVETRAGAPTASPSSLPPQYQYLWSPRYIDAPIQRDSFDGSGQIQPASRVFYLADANYNVTALVNTSGQVLERYAYDPYGAAAIYKPDWSGTQSPTLYNNTVLYTGKVLDVETGLYYYLARYYQPALGRFLASDPTGFAAGDANLYRYVRNSPTMFDDPSGMVTIDRLRGTRTWAPSINPTAIDDLIGSKWTVDFNPRRDFAFLAQKVHDTGSFTLECDNLHNEVDWSEDYYEAWGMHSGDYAENHLARPKRPAVYMTKEGGFSLSTKGGSRSATHLYLKENDKWYKVGAWDFEMDAKFDAVNGNYVNPDGTFLSDGSNYNSSPDDFKVTKFIIDSNEVPNFPKSTDDFDSMLYPRLAPGINGFPNVINGPHITLHETWSVKWKDGETHATVKFTSPRNYT